MANSSKKDKLKVVDTISLSGIQVDIIEDHFEGRSLPYYKASSPYRPYQYEGEEQRGRILSKNEMVLACFALGKAYLRIGDLEAEDKAQSGKKEES